MSSSSGRGIFKITGEDEDEEGSSEYKLDPAYQIDQAEEGQEKAEV